MLIRSLVIWLLCAGGSVLLHAQGYMSSPGFRGKHVQFKFSSNQFYDVFEIAPGYTYGGALQELGDSYMQLMEVGCQDLRIVRD